MASKSSVEQFLSLVATTAESFSGLRAGDTIIPLVHPFWSPDEIAQSFDIKEEWDVSDDLIPFYGDWHELLCISVATGKIVMLNDERSLVFARESGDGFLGCLTSHPDMEGGPGTSEDLGVVSGWLNF